MARRPITRFVDVAIEKDTPRVSVAGFGILMVVTDNALLSPARRLRRFTTAESVGAFFGVLSEEYKAADAFFYQDPFNAYQPEEINFGRFVDADSKALLECGNEPETDIDTWKAVSDGEFSIDIDGATVEVTGLDFSSVTSLDDVATVIDTGLAANGDCYFLLNRFNFVSTTTGATSLITLLSTVVAPAGTDISGSAFLAGDVAYDQYTALEGAIISQGQVAENFDTALSAIEAVNSDWYAMSAIKKYRDTDEAEDMADEISSRRKMFILCTNDSNTKILGTTSTFAYYLKQASTDGYKRCGTLYRGNSALYSDMSWMGYGLPYPVGSFNWAYKTLPGIEQGAESDNDPDVLSEAERDAIEDVNANFYAETLAAECTYKGTMGGGRDADRNGEYIDIVRNVDFLQARCEEQLFSLLLEKDIIPMTNAGISTVENRLLSVLDEYGVKQGILVEGSVETSFPKRSEISRTDRDDRLLPNGTFSAELQGAIDTIIIRGTVYV